MNKEFLENEKSKADDLIRQLGTLTSFDVRQLFYDFYTYKTFKKELYDKIVKHLNTKYDFTMELNGNILWYKKKLIDKKCLMCDNYFKTPSRGVKFCCDACRVKYEAKIK